MFHMLLYALLEAASRYRALNCNQYSAQRKYPSCKEDFAPEETKNLFDNLYTQNAMPFHGYDLFYDFKVLSSNIQTRGLCLLNTFLFWVNNKCLLFLVIYFFSRATKEKIEYIPLLDFK